MGWLGVRYRTPRHRVSGSGTGRRDPGSRRPVPDPETLPFKKAAQHFIIRDSGSPDMAHILRCEEQVWKISEIRNQLSPRCGAFVCRNGPNYRNGLPKRTLICALELDMRGHGDYLLRPIDIAMPPNKVTIQSIHSSHFHIHIQPFSSLISIFHRRPINRAPLGHTRFYCQGALFPWPDKTRNQFSIQFFTISRRHHSKWFGRYIYHISDHAFTFKQTMNHPFIPESYPFLLPNSVLCTLISVHKRN